MLKFVIVCCSVLAVALATNRNFEYLDNGNAIEYDVSPNMVSPMPYPYNGGFRGTRVIDYEPSPSASYAAVLVPEEAKTEIVSTKLGLLASAAFFAIACVKKAVFFVFKNWSALALGSTIALGICKLTPLCDKGHSFIELQREIRSYATPQRLARAAEMVESAVRKYNAMQ